MSLGRNKEEQRSLWLSFDQIPKSQGHAFYERLQKLLRKADFDALTMEANTAMKSIVRRDTGEGYQQMLVSLARASSVATPTAAELVAFDRRRKEETLSNQDWQSTTDEEARIGKLKDGRTHMAYKPEHVVDLESGAVVSAVVHPADQGDRKTMAATLDDAQARLGAVKTAVSSMLFYNLRLR